MRISAVVPAHNEAERIAATVTALHVYCDEVVVADDGSTDQTAAIAEEAGAHVLRLPGNRGKGSALTVGVAAATGDVLLLADADLGASASSLRILLQLVVGGDADIAIAAPAPGAPSGTGAVEALSRTGIRRLTGRTFRRPLSGQRALRRAVATELGFARGFGVETAMTIDALRAGYRVVEIPCDFTHAKTGRDLRGFLHRGKQGLDVLQVLIRRSLRRTPRHGIVQS